MAAKQVMQFDTETTAGRILRVVVSILSQDKVAFTSEVYVEVYVFIPTLAEKLSHRIIANIKDKPRRIGLTYTTDQDFVTKATYDPVKTLITRVGWTRFLEYTDTLTHHRDGLLTMDYWAHFETLDQSQTWSFPPTDVRGRFVTNDVTKIIVGPYIKWNGAYHPTQPWIKHEGQWKKARAWVCGPNGGWWDPIGSYEI